jgi:hypothetical protein
MSSRHDLREDPQLKERNPQLIPKISQVVAPLQAYIKRPSHGERYRKDWRYETYDFVGKIQYMDRERDTKLMIS